MKIKETKKKTKIPKKYFGVHENHCCVIHGCKYGEKDCSVVLKITKQKYPCEFCNEEE